MNETWFHLTVVKRNSLFERTPSAPNFRRRRNSSLTSFARPSRYSGSDNWRVCGSLPVVALPNCSASLRNFALPAKPLSSILNHAFGKGDRKSMTLLPSFKGKGIRENAEIRTSPDSRLTGVKRLAALDPSFFLLAGGGFAGWDVKLPYYSFPFLMGAKGYVKAEIERRLKRKFINFFGSYTLLYGFSA